MNIGIVFHHNIPSDFVANLGSGCIFITINILAGFGDFNAFAIVTLIAVGNGDIGFRRNYNSYAAGITVGYIISVSLANYAGIIAVATCGSFGAVRSCNVLAVKRGFNPAFVSFSGNDQIFAADFSAAFGQRQRFILNHFDFPGVGQAVISGIAGVECQLAIIRSSDPSQFEVIRNFSFRDTVKYFLDSHSDFLNFVDHCNFRFITGILVIRFALVIHNGNVANLCASLNIIIHRGGDNQSCACVTCQIANSVNTLSRSNSLAVQLCTNKCQLTWQNISYSYTCSLSVAGVFNRNCVINRFARFNFCCASGFGNCQRRLFDNILNVGISDSSGAARKHRTYCKCNHVVISIANINFSCIGITIYISIFNDCYFIGTSHIIKIWCFPNHNQLIFIYTCCIANVKCFCSSVCS